MDENDRYARGLRERRAVLGRAYVDRTLGAATDLDRDFQRLLTRYVWGEIWTRPKLPRKTRRLLVLATMVALNRLDELRLHLRAALQSGVSRGEIQEVLLQSAVYCGVPAARAAFEVASELWAEAGTGSAGPRTRKAPRVVRKRTR